MSTSISDNLQQTSREERVRTALYRGEALTLANPVYLRAARALAEELLRQDCETGDRTVEAMGVGARRCIVEIQAKEAGVAAGMEEANWLYESHGQSATGVKRDGEFLLPGDILMRIEGDAHSLLALERTAVNLLQRMSGIATATRRLAAIANDASPTAHIVATRKTPWGLLDKRAVHAGGGGTHRLNLGDAILIKTNHLTLASIGMTEKFDKTLRQAWQWREGAAFFEVEVTSSAEAVAAARLFAELQAEANACPCLLLLDNFSAQDAKSTVRTLHDTGLHDAVIVEASGGVSESSVAAYAAAGVDAISLGALTHSVRALDLSAKLISRGEVARP
ncbi:MAG TPA: carboxylating nicotinate-nucleotide diphosphorylase [Candidatus Acidoferrales bacterium]|nr:carboxylating nicotinate-nucleotide diphosphorylase [Candidatus Acidoferrales bacterium]